MIDQADRHVYLYAKGHYKCTNKIKDLQRIFSVRNGIGPEFISAANIANMLLSMAYPYIESKHQWEDFIFSLRPSNRWKYWIESPNEYDFEEAVIGKCLSILAMTTVFDTESKKIIMDLGEPDSSILPLKNANSSNLKDNRRKHHETTQA